MIWYSAIKAKETTTKGDIMKAMEIKKGIEDAIDAYDGFNNKAERIYWDLLDVIDDGYIEDIDPKDVSLRNNRRQIHIKASDGLVTVVTNSNGEIEVNAYEDKPKVYPTRRKQSPYERTRAMVYATGNKWAIENFNALH